MPAVEQIQIYSGSLDYYNTISFSNGLSYTGAQLAKLSSAEDSPPDDKFNPSSNGLFYFSFSSDITSVTFATSQNSYEVAQVSGLSTASEAAAKGLASGVPELFDLGDDGARLRRSRLRRRPPPRPARRTIGRIRIRWVEPLEAVFDQTAAPRHCDRRASRGGQWLVDQTAIRGPETGMPIGLFAPQARGLGPSGGAPASRSSPLTGP